MLLENPDGTYDQVYGEGGWGNAPELVLSPDEVPLDAVIGDPDVFPLGEGE